MNILFATSEARPFIATSGLADVIGALSKSLIRAGCDCRVILPLYSDIPDELREKMHEIARVNVQLCWKKLFCGLFETVYEGVTYYFIDNENYFRRNGIYGHKDDGERFGFFCKAVLECIKAMDFEPDIIHCHDWQTGMIPAFRQVFYHDDTKIIKTKTIYTIHNIQHQGNYNMNFAEDVLGLSESKRPLVEYDGRCNYMKAGIDNCDAISTISPTYAKEIQNPWFAWGMDRLLREKAYKLAGILHGIDTESFDPETDRAIPANFSKHDLSGKAKCKSELQKELGLKVEPSAMLIGIVGRLVSHKGLELVKETFDKIMEKPVQFAILGDGESSYEGFFRYMQGKYPERVHFVCGYNPTLARRIYAGADTLLMPSKSEPCGLAQMLALRYGTIPIVHEIGGLKDSVKDLGGLKGNGFTFQKYGAAEMLNAVNRAYSLYQISDGWERAVLNALACDFSWSRSAHAYTRLYEAVLGRKG